MAPNCYLEVKGPEGSAAVARRQACYDGAIGARGMLSLHSYGKETMIYDNRAYTISSTYYDGMLKCTQPILPHQQTLKSRRSTRWRTLGLEPLLALENNFSTELLHSGMAETGRRNGEMSLSPSRLQKRDHQASNRPGTAAPQNSEKMPRWGFWNFCWRACPFANFDVLSWWGLSW